MADDDVAGLAEGMAAMTIADSRAGIGPSEANAQAQAPPMYIPLKSTRIASASALPPIPMRPRAQATPAQPPIPIKAKSSAVADQRSTRPQKSGANGPERELDTLASALASVSLGETSPASCEATPAQLRAEVAQVTEAADARGLRDYQRWMVDSLWGLLRRNRAARAAGTTQASAPGPSVLVYLPTGGGKTRVAAELIRLAVGADAGRGAADDSVPGYKAIFVVNRTKLAQQAGEALCKACGRDAVGFVQAGKADGSACRVVVATAQTLAARFLVDEVEGSGAAEAGGDWAQGQTASHSRPRLVTRPADPGAGSGGACRLPEWWSLTRPTALRLRRMLACAGRTEQQGRWW